jgi:CubicO group peptidase (beta-lactamase class C family)
MKWRLWFACGILVLLIMAVFALGAGHPARLLAGLVSGNEALDYLPPRRELRMEPGPPQPTLTLAEAGVDPESLELSMRYAEERNSEALVVGVNGHIVYQKYWGETSLDSALEASGFSPVLAALVLGNALQNRELRDLDAPLAKFLPEWSQDPRGTITLRDLLTGNSNLQAPGARPWPRTSRKTWAPICSPGRRPRSRRRRVRRRRWMPTSCRWPSRARSRLTTAAC